MLYLPIVLFTLLASCLASSAPAASDCAKHPPRPRPPHPPPPPPDAATHSRHRRCDPSTFTKALPSTAKIISVVPYASNSSFINTANTMMPEVIKNLPAFCAVHVNVSTSSTSAYEFALWLPDKWNGRFSAYGNGGFAGQIAYSDLGSGIHYGFAAVSTNTGHNSGFMGPGGQDDPTWALNNPERQTDWGWRAMHGTVELGKVLTNVYYGSDPKYSYYFGCSTGGRQGLKSVQMFPEDFDGVVAGAPAWWTTHLQQHNLKVSTYNLPKGSPHHIPPELFPVVKDEVFRQCDGIDGVKDGIIMDPYACNFRPEALLCTPSRNKSACLNGDQIDTLKKVYSDWVDVNQTFVFPHLTLSSEADWGLSLNAMDENTPPGIGYARMFLFNDPKWPWQKLDYSVVQLAETLNPGNATADKFDMSDFQARGGKLLHYHGTSDGSIATGSSIHYYNQVVRAMTSAKETKLDDFYKFYLIPGMRHCFMGVDDAPWYISGAGQKLRNNAFGTPGFDDERHDVVRAIMNWVENGKAPQELISSKFNNDDAAKGVKMQRPLCAYPKQAKYKGGPVEKPESFECR